MGHLSFVLLIIIISLEADALFQFLPKPFISRAGFNIVTSPASRLAAFKSSTKFTLIS